MTRLPSTPESSIDAMCRAFMRGSVRSPRTIRFYRETCRIVANVLREGGRPALPWKIGEEDVVWLLRDLSARGLAVQTRKGYFSALRTWLRFYDNRSVDGMEVRWPADARPNVDWLTLDQARDLLAAPKTPTEALVVHCELCLGMRRVEVLRLKPSSFSGGFVEILGKGPQGGKPRRMPYHRDTAAVLAAYLRHRASLVETARAACPGEPVPDDLLVWSRGPRLCAYAGKGTGIDRMLKGLGARIGVPTVSNHTLRRTFGRTMFRSGVEPAVIAKMLGHSSIEQTLRYIGVDGDDMDAAMKIFKL